MASLTRRRFLRSICAYGLGCASASLLAACRQRIVEVERVVQVEKEVTKIVPQVVRETVIVESTPQIIEKTVEIERLVTAEPAPKPKAIIVADVTPYGWTQLAMRMSPTFQETFPSIEVRWRSLTDWHQYPAHVATLHASGTLGDLIEAPFGSLMARWARDGLIQPLDPVAEADGFDSSALLASAITACTHDGALIALPFLAHSGESLLLYHRGRFDAHSLAYPTADWSLDSLAQAGLTLSEAPDTDFGGSAYAVRYDLPGAYPALSLCDAALISANGRATSVDSDHGVAALRWAHEMIYDLGLAETPQTVERGPIEMLRTGRVAMLRHGFDTLVALRRHEEQSGGENASEAGEPSIDAVLYPTHPLTGKRGSVATGMAYCITQPSEQPEQTFQWLKYMSSREMGVQMFLGGYAEPGCRVESWADERVLEDYPICAQLAELSQSAGIAHLPQNLRLEECIAAWNRGVRSLLRDESTAEASAASIAEEIRAILKEPAKGEPVAG